MSPGLAPAGLVLVGVSLFLWLLRRHFREGRWFDRPRVARHQLFDPLLAVVGWSALAAGLGLLWRAAPPAALVTVALLLGLAGWRQLARSAIMRARSMRRRQSVLRAAHPGLSERDALRRVILERHPEWGEELVEQMMLDYGSTEEMARVMTRMERGFRGFH
jgi:ABC-type dipeptide/oligopeptide/nickel transport system permease subunit